MFKDFQEKAAKSVGFCGKPSKLTDLAETSNFSCKLPCFRIFKFSAKRLQKVWDFVKNYENSSIWPKLGFCEKPLKPSSIWLKTPKSSGHRYSRRGQKRPRRNISITTIIITELKKKVNK